MITIKVSRVKLDNGGYDSGGKYFGNLRGLNLYCADLDDGNWIRREYIRAPGYQEARNHFKSFGRVEK